MTESPPLEDQRPVATPDGPRSPVRWWWLWAIVLTLSLLAMQLGWRAHTRVKLLEQELVKRQDASAEQAAEAVSQARAVTEATRDLQARVINLETKLQDLGAQRAQLDDMVQSLLRLRDDSLVMEIDTALRVAIQQSQLTGSGEPVLQAMRASQERLKRSPQARLEPVRRALERDLVKWAEQPVPEVGTMVTRLDELVRLVDVIPLWSGQDSLGPLRDGGQPQSSQPQAAGTGQPSPNFLLRWATAALDEARHLLRVTRIDHPEAMLLAPDQAFFLRENLKLRLLNARLAILSRQFDTAAADLNQVRKDAGRYLDKRHRSYGPMMSLLDHSLRDARPVPLPIPTDSLAALSAAGAVR